MHMERSDTRRYSLEEIEEQRAQGRSETRHDAPEHAVDDAFWREARVVMPPGKTSVHLRLDADVLEWFKAQGPGHLTRMNAVLRAFMEAHRRRGSAP
ncbi:MAG TPA: BrnA antitoxin family protein [Acetobacteraceae bacterium]|nr:BrnA antitoxin family protein [Acetobacteraceae bacterium]